MEMQNGERDEDFVIGVGIPIPPQRRNSAPGKWAKRVQGMLAAKQQNPGKDVCADIKNDSQLQSFRKAAKAVGVKFTSRSLGKDKGVRVWFSDPAGQ